MRLKASAGLSCLLFVLVVGVVLVVLVVVLVDAIVVFLDVLLHSIPLRLRRA